MSARTVALLASAILAGTTALAAPALAASPTSPAPTPTQAACDKTPWQASVQGNADLKAGQAAGVYLWHNTKGFHLAVTHVKTDRQVYRGTVTASAPMRMDPVRLEGRDTVALSANRRTLTFVFYNYGHIDGVNFHTDCASALAVSHMTRGSSRLGAAHVYLGAKRVHPAKVPFVVHRIPTPAG